MTTPVAKPRVAGAPRVVVSELTRTWETRRGEPIMALDRATFDIRSGEVLGLLGPNGAGKTTTMRLLATLVQPTSGTARICGHDVVKEPVEVRKRIGYLSSTSGLPPRLSCRETLLTFARLHGLADPHRAADAVTEKYAIGPFAHRFVEELSVGMRQRLRVAAATIHDPQVWLFDEPTAGLDIVAASQLASEIASARERGAAVLLSTHFLREAEQLCDRIAILYEGRVMAVDRLDSLLETTGTPTLELAFIALVGKATGLTQTQEESQ